MSENDKNKEIQASEDWRDIALEIGLGVLKGIGKALVYYVENQSVYNDRETRRRKP